LDVSPRKREGIEVRVAADGTKTYRIRWRQDGRNLSHSFTREKQAADARSSISAAGNVCHCPKHVPRGLESTKHYGPSSAKPKGPTLSEYAERHAAAMTGVGEGYRRDVTRDIRRHMQLWADRPIESITELEVREWIRGMETGAHPWLNGKPLSAATVRRNLAQAGAVMTSAMNDGLVSRNPFRGHRLARKDVDHNGEQVFLTHAEWDLLAAHLPEGVYRDLCTVLVGTGLRWGEAAALPVGAVDLLADPPRLHVARAWKKDGKGGVVLGTPKSARSRRTVTFPSWVLEALIPHVAGKADDEFVFTTPRGRPLIHSNFYGDVWQPAVRAAQDAGLAKRPRLHDLRHTQVSWLIAAGLPAAAISRRIGHQSITLTIDRYGHLMPQLDADAITALERVKTRS
jgi:integrase